ncbi:MAG: hypothetical protein KDK39_13880 [Leptospiraceae bacterium]|nr:hypothetical protein [Leptospiraceae bacterium]
MPADYVSWAMELWALVLVNIVTGVVLYFFFAMRYSRAIQQRDRGIVEQMARIALEMRTQSESTLEQIARKQESVYQLARLVEDLSLKLLSAEPDSAPQSKPAPRSTKPGTKKKGPATVKARPGPRQATKAAGPSTRKAAPNRSASSAGQPASAATRTPYREVEPESSAEQAAALRALASLPPDRLDLMPATHSVEDAWQQGRLLDRLEPGASNPASSGPVRPLPGAASATDSFGRQAGGWVRQLGQLTRRLFGIETYTAAAPTQPAIAKPNDASAVGPGFEELLGRQLAQKQATVPSAPAPLVAESEAGAAEPATADLLPDLELPYTSPVRFEMRPRPSSSVDPDEPPVSRAIEGERRQRLADHQAQYAPAELAGQPLSYNPAQERQDFIRSLLQKGMADQEVMAQTGATLGELQLLRNLPQNPRPRKYRIRT